MSQLHSIPTRKTSFSFLKEIDFNAFETMLNDKSASVHAIVRPAAREDDIEGMRLNLLSANTSSVWLQGEEGVGKTTVISGFLQKIAHKEVTASLLGRRVFLFNSHDFFKADIANGFASFDRALEYLNSMFSLLIFDRIDDFVTTANSNATFYANALIDCLSEGHMQAIVTSQIKTRGMLDKASTAFAPSFVEQIVLPPNREGVLATLRANRQRLEFIHEVCIPEEAIQEAVRVLELRPGRAFTQVWPQGPLALLDKSCAYVRMSRYALPPDIIVKNEMLLQLEDELTCLHEGNRGKQKRVAEIEAQITSLKSEVEPARAAWKKQYAPFQDSLNAIANTESEIDRIMQRAQSPKPLTGDAEKDKPKLLSEDRKELNEQKEQLERQKKASAAIYAELNANKPSVCRADVQRIFAKAAGMSENDVSGDERAKLLHAEEELGKGVFGQPKALAAVADILRSARTGVSDPGRPAGVILLVGPTGVGKTETMKVLATVDGGAGAEPIIFPMNQFQEESSISEFRGAARGLVGYEDEGPPMLQKIRKNGRVVVGLDEIEKAHPNFFKVNMSMLDEGTIQDSASNVVSFKDAIVILTSNVVLPDDLEKYDVDWSNADVEQKTLREAIIAKINPETGLPFFKPEFVGRIDMIVMFDYLKKSAACSILRKEIVKQNKSLEEKNYHLEASDDTIAALMNKYFEKGSNGRTVRQFYNRVIRSQISKTVLQDKIAPGEDELRNIYVNFDGNNVTLNMVQLSDAHVEIIRELEKENA